MDKEVIKGTRLEKIINRRIRKLPGYKRCLNNVIIPSKHGSTEIDVILIHEKGIFVFEAKNYSGWIFGNENDQNWTQCLPNGEKNRFYNPLKQNDGHIDALYDFLGDNFEVAYSYIVFGENCKLKNVTTTTQTHLIVNSNNLFDTINRELNELNTIYSKDKVDAVYCKLKGYAKNNNRKIFYIDFIEKLREKRTETRSTDKRVFQSNQNNNERRAKRKSVKKKIFIALIAMILISSVVSAERDHYALVQRSESSEGNIIYNKYADTPSYFCVVNKTNDRCFVTVLHHGEKALEFFVDGNSEITVPSPKGTFDITCINEFGRKLYDISQTVIKIGDTYEIVLQ